MLVATTVLLTAYFSTNKIYQRQKGSTLRADFGFNALLGDMELLPQKDSTETLDFGAISIL